MNRAAGRRDVGREASDAERERTARDVARDVIMSREIGRDEAADADRSAERCLPQEARTESGDISGKAASRERERPAGNVACRVCVRRQVGRDKSRHADRSAGARLLEHLTGSACRADVGSETAASERDGPGVDERGGVRPDRDRQRSAGSGVSRGETCPDGQHALGREARRGRQDEVGEVRRRSAAAAAGDLDAAGGRAVADVQRLGIGDPDRFACGRSDRGPLGVGSSSELERHG